MRITRTMMRWRLCLIICLMASGFICALPCSAQTGQDDSKTIDPPDTRGKPSARRGGRQSAPSKRNQSDTKYQVPKSSSFGEKPPRGKTHALIGVTVLRLRPATAKDAGDTAKEIRRKRDTVSERIDDSSYLAPGDEVRISIESPVAGYLYVVNRELYADGPPGRALLIFPTLSSYGGDNRIEPRVPRLIPDPDGVFEITPNNSGKRRVAERLTIIISRQPLNLPGPLTDVEMELPPGWIEKWERAWSGKTDRAAMKGGVGQTQTTREQAAGRLNARELRNKRDQSLALTRDDPLPQNFYQVTVRPGVPTLVVVPLKFKTQ